MRSSYIFMSRMVIGSGIRRVSRSAGGSDHGAMAVGMPRRPVLVVI